MNTLLRKKKKSDDSHKFRKTDREHFKSSRSLKKDSEVSYVNIETIAQKIEHEPALIRIGKNGVSDSIISEIIRLVKIKKAVKVKILQNSPIENSKSFFEELEATIGYKIWRKKGNTAIFIYRNIE